MVYYRNLQNVDPEKATIAFLVGGGVNPDTSLPTGLFSGDRRSLFPPWPCIVHRSACLAMLLSFLLLNVAIWRHDECMENLVRLPRQLHCVRLRQCIAVKI